MSAGRSRQELAQAAARLMAEQGLRDYARAKNKAIESLAAGRAQAPSNQEIAACLREYLELFEGEAWEQRLRNLREVALKAMTLCAPFRPRAVGAVVDGLATRRSSVQLHVFCPFDEALDFHLGDRQIPFDSAEKRFRHPSGQELCRPCCVFMAGEVEIEITVFGEDDVRWSPLSVIDGRPMPRIDEDELKALLAGHKKTA